MFLVMWLHLVELRIEVLTDKSRELACPPTLGFTNHKEKFDMTTQIIVRRLTQKTRQRWPLGYETVRLLFTNDHFVCATDREPRVFEEVERLLQQGERPLGYIARLREGPGKPFVEPCVSGDEAVLAKLNDTARYWYHHRM